MLAAVESIRSLNPERIMVAVPIDSASSAGPIAREVDECLCMNIRRGDRFSVAEAYRNWYNLDDRELLAELQAYQGQMV
jgi:predicted phosphoribosyltransferase